MSRSFLLAAATAATVAAMSLAAAPSAEARKHHHHKHRWGGVSVIVGAPIVYGGYRRHYGYSPYYYRSEPYCRRFGWVYSRSGKAKWRCVAW